MGGEMRPIVLLVGKLPGVIGDIARQLSDMEVEWLGAHDHAASMLYASLDFRAVGHQLDFSRPDA